MKWVMDIMLVVGLFWSAQVFAQDKTIITGKVINPLAKTVYFQYPKTTVHYNMIDGVVKLEEDQTYRIEILMDRPMEVYWRPKQNAQMLYLAPGDSLHIEVDMDNFDASLIFSGKSADNNRYLFRLRQKHSDVLKIDYKHLHFDAFKQIVDVRRTQLARFFSENHAQYALSEEFITYLKLKSEYEWAHLMVSYPMHFRLANRQTEETLPDGYEDYFNEVTLDNEAGIGLLHYQRFLTTYFRQRGVTSNWQNIVEERNAKLEVEQLAEGKHVTTTFSPAFVGSYGLAQEKLSGRVRYWFQAREIIGGYQSGEFELAEHLFGHFKMFNPYKEYVEVVEEVRQKVLVSDSTGD